MVETKMENIGMPMIHERRKAMFGCLRYFFVSSCVPFRHEQMNVTLLALPMFSCLWPCFRYFRAFDLLVLLLSVNSPIIKFFYSDWIERTKS